MQKKLKFEQKIFRWKKNHNSLGQSQDELEDEEVHNAQEPSSEDIENKMKSSIEKEFKQSFKNWKYLDRGMKWQEKIPELSTPGDRIDNIYHF